MGDTTDELLELASEVSPSPHPRERDMLLTAGERISMALLSMAINDLGREAVSFTGSQAGIVTDTAHGRARIVAMRSDRVREALDAGRIVIVAGFQGVSTTLDVTTLGRGGSDTTAVALAAALGADVCEIYTDVEGVFTADPRIVPEARKLDTLTYEEMLDLAAVRREGADAPLGRVRSQPWRAAARSLVVLRRGGHADREPGGVARERDHLRESRTTRRRRRRRSSASPTSRASRRASSGSLADAGVNVDMIVQNVSAAGHTDISFTLPKDDVPAAERILRELAGDDRRGRRRRATPTSRRSR